MTAPRKFVGRAVRGGLIALSASGILVATISCARGPAAPAAPTLPNVLSVLTEGSVGNDPHDGQEGSPDPSMSEKIHPDLAMELLQAAHAHSVVNVTVGLQDGPDPVPDLAALHPLGDVDLPSASELALEAARRAENRDVVRALTTTFGAKLIGYCLLARCVDVAVAADQVMAIAALTEVIHLDPFSSSTQPPAEGCSENPSCAEMDVVAEFLNVDRLRRSGLINTRIALLDSGTNQQHRLLREPSSLRYVGRVRCTDGDCTTLCTDPECDARRTLDLGTPEPDVCGHGSKSASVLIANDRLGRTNEGLTSFTLDSLQVYNMKDDKCHLNHVVTRRSIEYAFLRLGSKVILVEAQENGGRKGWLTDISRTADSASRHGTVVIAPNGNGPDAALPTPVGTPARGPGNARNVISAGVEVLKGRGVGTPGIMRQTISGYYGGRMQDGRRKPDVLGISATCGAAGATCLDRFDGTSGAAASVAAVAALLRARLEQEDASHTAPGFTYAHLILSGRYAGDAAARPEAPVMGAGGMCVPDLQSGAHWTGVTRVGAETLERIEPSFNLAANLGNGQEVAFDVAAWWPETMDNDMEMVLTSPAPGGCTWRATDPGGVFLKLKVTNHPALRSLPRGAWSLSLRNRTSTPALVYWAAAAHAVPPECRATSQPVGFAASTPEAPCVGVP